MSFAVNGERTENVLSVFDAMEGFPRNNTIADNFIRGYSIINRSYYDKVMATISGGSDSDVVLDILTRADQNKKIDYIWLDTGLEYQATKDHLEYLEEKYGIKIKRVRPKKPIPVAVKEYGQPFCNKRAAGMIGRLQAHNFKWEDAPYEELLRKYPNCKGALDWWCNKNISNQLNICNNKLLKEFLIANPPTFKISDHCCECAKKTPVKHLIQNEGYQLNIYGVRKAEGGNRSTAYHSCFGNKSHGKASWDEYRPLYWYTSEDKRDYCEALNIVHSECYTKYGLQRTGCCGCPFGRDFEHELEILEKYEPKLYKAANNIFKDSYEYTRKYHQFVKDNA